MDVITVTNRYLFISIAILLTGSSCIKKPGPPVVLTAQMTEITQNYATSGGTVLDDGGGDVKDSGVCWSTDENPKVSDKKASCGAGTGSFIIRLTKLSPNTRYYVRAYATNSSGTGYGNQVIFITGGISPPELLTTAVTDIDLASASTGGFIYDFGGGQVSEKGVCWSTSQSPTILDNKTIDSYLTNLPGRFTSKLTGLELGMQYYVRAYATNNAGTSYGNELSFATLSVGPPYFNSALIYGNVSDIDGNLYRTIQIGTQTWLAENLKTTKFNDGTSIPVVIGDNNWANRSAAAMCWFNDDPDNYKDIYGGYYNRYTVNTKKLCPEGWHVPDKTDWSLMISYLGNEGLAGGKMKEPGTTNWMSPNSGANNESGFTGLPCGYRSNKFLLRGASSYWWSASSSYIYSGTYYDSYVMDYRYKSIRIIIITDSGSGLNIRCVKDL